MPVLGRQHVRIRPVPRGPYDTGPRGTSLWEDQWFTGAVRSILPRPSPARYRASRPGHRGTEVRQVSLRSPARASSRARCPTQKRRRGNDLRFNLAAVDHLKLCIDEHNAARQTFFAGCSVEPVEVVYEDLVEDYAGTVSRVMREIGIPVPDGFAPTEPKMKQQADELSEEWVRLYNEAKASRESTYAGRL